MVEENRSPKFRLRNINDTTNYFLEEIKHNELMSRKDKKESTTLNYIHFLFLISAIKECISISDFTSLIGNPIWITSSVIGLKLCQITAGIKKYQSIFNKEKKKVDKIPLVAKFKLNTLGVLISKTSINSFIIHDEIILINNLLKEYDEMREEIKNLQEQIKNLQT